MFQWATSTFDKISQTVAPPPTDGASRFAYAVQRNEEENAMGCIAEIDPARTVVNHAKGLYPIHMACQYSMIRLIQLLMNQPGLHIEQPDSSGNTPLHHAAMSSNPAAGLECVKLLIQQYGASVLAKNYQGQTPYDVASLNGIRQFILPIQLQAETQIALDNGGQGLPPGIDLGGLRIKNHNMAPPPTQFGAPPPAMQPPASPAPSQMTPQNAGHPPQPNMFGTPTPDQNRIVSAPVSSFAPAPASGPPGAPNTYSRVGSSSGAILKNSKYRADGFHSSSSDVGLQKKYGHVGVPGNSFVPPPPSSGNSIPSAPSSANSGPNPFAGGASLPVASRYGAVPPANRRYVAYGQVAPAPASQPVYNANLYAAPLPANISTFTPGNQAASPAALQPESAPYAQQQQQQQQQQTYPTYGIQTAPYSAPSPSATTPQQQPNYANPATSSTSYMPPPPYQSQNYSQPAVGTTPYKRPDAVSPAAATYGSPATPGNLGTPFQSPPPASNVFAAPSPHNVEPATTGVDATGLFAAPPQQTTQGPPAATNSAPAASGVFAASPQQATNEPASTSGPAATDVFSAPPQQTTQDAPASAAALASFAAPATTQDGPVASDTFAASAPQAQQPATSSTFMPPATQNQQSFQPTFVPPAPKSAEELFGSEPPPPHHQHQEEQQATSETAKQLFAENAPTVQAAAVLGSGPGKIESIGQNASDVDQGDGQMDEIPLSPKASAPQIAQAQPAATTSEAESLFATIGMPPPPFTAKNR